MNPPVDISPLLVSIQCSFKLLEFLVPDAGPWDWSHPTLSAWMTDNGFATKDDVLDNPAAAYVVAESLEKKVWSCQQNVKQLTLPIVTTPHWGAWVDPQSEVSP